MNAEMIECPKCGATNDASDESCAQCGVVFWKHKLQSENKKIHIKNEDLHIRAAIEFGRKNYNKAKQYLEELLHTNPEYEETIKPFAKEIEDKLLELKEKDAQRKEEDAQRREEEKEKGKEERSKVEKIKVRADVARGRKRLEEKALRKLVRQDEATLLIPKFVRNDLPPVETPLISRIFFVFAILSLISGILLCYLTWPEEAPENYEWKAVAYSMPVTWIWIGFIEAVVFWALGQGMMYLKGIYENTRSKI